MKCLCHNFATATFLLRLTLLSYKNVSKQDLQTAHLVIHSCVHVSALAGEEAKEPLASQVLGSMWGFRGVEDSQLASKL
jgi:hypothetical protein